MNTPYTTPTGLQIGILYSPRQVDEGITSTDSVRLQRALLSSKPRTCHELGVCQSRVPPCQGCTVPPKDAWTALCMWLVRRFG